MKGYRYTYDEKNRSNMYTYDDEKIDLIAANDEAAIRKGRQKAIKAKAHAHSRIVFKKLEVVFEP